MDILTSIRLSPSSGSGSKDGIISPPTFTSRNSGLISEATFTNNSKSEIVAKPRVVEHGTVPHTTAINSSESSLAVLKQQPSFQELSNALAYLTTASDGFDIRESSPLTSRIVNVLVADTIPTFWTIIQTHKIERDGLMYCLYSVTGLSGIVGRLRLLNRLSREPKTASNETRKANDSRPIWDATHIKDLLQVLARMLKGKGVVHRFWSQLYDTPDKPSTPTAKHDLVWKELVSLLAGGKLLSIVAEADIILDERDEASVEDRKGEWLGDGKKYATWLGQNISHMMMQLPIEESEDVEPAWKRLGFLVSRGLGLGYVDALIDQKLYSSFSHMSEDFFVRIRKLFASMPQHDQRTYINVLLKTLTHKYLSSASTGKEEAELIAGLVWELCRDYETNHDLRTVCLEWISGHGGAGSGEPISIRRAIFAAINDMSDGIIILQDLLEKNVANFGDPLWIRHAPTIHQEAGAQCLLLAASYVHRQPPSYVKVVARSSAYLNAISNRLGSTNTRVKFLGMIVGEAISKLVDTGLNVLSFSGIEEDEGTEAILWRYLVGINDKVATMERIRRYQPSQVVPRPKKKVQAPVRMQQTSKVLVIEELDDDYIDDTNGESVPIPQITEVEDEVSEDDMTPYGKPDSDPEDSDDDADLVDRNKISPPVYIRDLLYMLHDGESYAKQKLALEHATTLIRRKSNFGSELRSNLTELLETLIGLQDKYDMDEFDSMRLKAVIALVAASPVESGRWMSRYVFDGAYSLSQRCVMLSAIGFGALELGGDTHNNTESLMKFERTDADKAASSFPSKKLSKRLHDVYAYKSTPIDALSIRLQDMMIQPMAQEAADKLSGPDILKVRKFSTRMDVEARKKAPIANKLAIIVTDAFFAPLLGQWWARNHDASQAYLHPHLLSLYIKTLTILLHATGPNSLVLPSLTSSFWDLLLSLRHHPLTNKASTVMDAVLLGFLTILDVNEGRNLAEGNAKELMGTQEWVIDVFEGGSGAEGDGEKRRALAAGILVRTREIAEKYERLLIGQMIG